MSVFCLVVVVVVVTVVVDVVFVVVIVLDVVQVPFKVYLRLLEMEVEFWWVWWDGGLWWAVLVCRPIFMSNPTQLSWKGHLPCAVRQDVYYLSYFCPFGRQKVEKAPSWLHLWLAFSTNAQNSKIREVVTAPFSSVSFQVVLKLCKKQILDFSQYNGTSHLAIHKIVSQKCHVKLDD